MNSLRRNPHRLFHGVAQILFFLLNSQCWKVQQRPWPWPWVKVNKHKKSGSFWVSLSWFVSKLSSTYIYIYISWWVDHHFPRMEHVGLSMPSKCEGSSLSPPGEKVSQDDTNTCGSFSKTGCKSGGFSISRWPMSRMLDVVVLHFKNPWRFSQNLLGSLRNQKCHGVTRLGYKTLSVRRRRTPRDVKGGQRVTGCLGVSPELCPTLKSWESHLESSSIIWNDWQSGWAIIKGNRVKNGRNFY